LFAVFWQAIPAAGGKVKSIVADRRRLSEVAIHRDACGKKQARRNKPQETSVDRK
jgi:hypothetical protein